MNRKVLARIDWLTPAQGARQHPPTGPRYSTVARFERAAEKWPNEAWSIVAEFVEGSTGTGGTLAEICFLAPNAPDELLEPGSKFDLFEGRRLVARGEVLNAACQSSDQESQGASVPVFK